MASNTIFLGIAKELEESGNLLCLEDTDEISAVEDDELATTLCVTDNGVRWKKLSNVVFCAGVLDFRFWFRFIFLMCFLTITE